MTRDEAITECSRLAREHPDRATHSWLPRELAPGEWAVVRVVLALGAPPAGDDRTRRGDARDAGEADELPGHPHGCVG